MDRKRSIEPKPGRCRGRALGLALAVAWFAASGPAAPAQIPGLPAVPKPAPAKADGLPNRPTPLKGDPGTVFSATTGPIHVDEKDNAEGIRTTLEDLLVQFPGVRTVALKVKDGVVTIDGQVDDDDSLDDVTAFAQKVDGVHMVLNKMKTDAEVMTGRQLAAKVLGEYRDIIGKDWLLAILAAAFVVGFATLARLFARYSESLLAPFLRNQLLRSVVGSVISSLLILGGILIGLSILNLTHAVLSVLGLAGVAGLALGFAFRDIAENFIASMLLGIRRPFQIGDFVTVAGKSGSVLSLDTRATTLITPEGNYVRIPNAVIYKETMVNASTSPSTLGTTEVVVPYESSSAEAIEAINEALRATDGLLQDPKPRALVQALEVGGVRLKATYWMPTRGIDGDKIQSDLRLKIKVGLQKAGINPPSHYATISVAGKIPVEMIEARDGDRRVEAGRFDPRPGSPPPEHQAAANLRKDAAAADAAGAEACDAPASPIDHAIQKAEAEAVKDGNNMLVSAPK